MHFNLSDTIFRMVRFNESDQLKNIVSENNANSFVNEYEQNLLHEAISSKSYEILNYLLECNIDVNHTDRDGKTPLHYSTAYNDYYATELLLKRPSIEVNKKDIHGNNPMWVATFNARGYYEVVLLLKANGGDPNSKNNSNRSAIDFANQIEDDDLTKILLS